LAKLESLSPEMEL